MGESLELQGINDICKQKIVFHKYANSVKKMHICSGSQMGLITTKEGGQKERGTKVSLDHRQEHSSQVHSLLCSDPPRLLWPQWALGPGGT